MAHETGHLLMGMGGTGGRAIEVFCKRYKGTGCNFHVATLVVDTDKDVEAIAPSADRRLNIAITRAELATFQAEPEMLSNVGQQILRAHEGKLSGSFLGSGSATRRQITQLFLEAPGGRHKVVMAIRAMVDQLRDTGCQEIQPHIVGSQGGGAGSALVVLVAHLLGDLKARAVFLEGCSSLEFLAPIIHVADATGNARKNEYPQSDRIRVNQFFNTIEVSDLMRNMGSNADRLGTCVTMTGFGNGTKWLDDNDRIAAELGANLTMFVRFHRKILARETDFTLSLIPDGQYHGRDGIPGHGNRKISH